MKFARLLRDTAHELPELGPLFSIYKKLKRHVKTIRNQAGLELGENNIGGAEDRFVEALTNSVQELNDSFLEREENIIIVMDQLQACAAQTTTYYDTQAVLRSLVNLHGEMLLLLHWSILAYSAVVKILKKHFKRTGLRVECPLLQNLMSQPFCSTEVVGTFVHQAEALIQSLSNRLANLTTPPAAATTPQATNRPSLPPESSRNRPSSPSPQQDPPPPPTLHAALNNLTAHMPHIPSYVQADSSQDGDGAEGEGQGGSMDVDVEEGDEVTSSMHGQAPHDLQAQHSGPHPLAQTPSSFPSHHQAASPEASQISSHSSPPPNPTGQTHPTSQGSAPPASPSHPPPPRDPLPASCPQPQPVAPQAVPAPQEAAWKLRLAPEQVQANILRQTQVALETWSNLVSNASTPSTIFPPPSHPPQPQPANSQSMAPAVPPPQLHAHHPPPAAPRDTPPSVSTSISSTPSGPASSCS